MASTTITPADSSPYTRIEESGDTPSSKPTLSTSSTSAALPATPSTKEVLAASAPLDPIPRFWYLLLHATSLIRLHGPYTTHANTTVLARADKPRSSIPTKAPSAKLLATSFAAAQDAHGTAQPDGPAKDDLELFTLLWKTTIQVVEKILEDGHLDGEAFGWGVYGLSFGYMPSFPSLSSSISSSSLSSSSSKDSANFDDDLFPRHDFKPLIPAPQPSSKPQTAFDALRHRLHTALLSLPGVNGSQRDKGMSSVSPAERVGRLVKTRNEVHLCATLLMQRFRGEEWAGVRWGFLIAVVERWLGRLELARMGREEGDL